MELDEIGGAAADFGDLARTILLSIVLGDAVGHAVETLGAGLGGNFKLAFGDFESAGHQAGAVAPEMVDLGTTAAVERQAPVAENGMVGRQRRGRSRLDSH